MISLYYNIKLGKMSNKVDFIIIGASIFIISLTINIKLISKRKTYHSSDKMLLSNLPDKLSQFMMKKKSKIFADSVKPLYSVLCIIHSELVFSNCHVFLNN